MKISQEKDEVYFLPKKISGKNPPHPPTMGI